jgi:polyphosphate kinase
VDSVFLTLSSGAPPGTWRRLLTAPNHLHQRMLELLEQVSAVARTGRPARVVLKVNALTDPALCDALAAASSAGVEIDLIVRGACTLRPGVPGATERIRVRSVVGRFLEHSRVFYFRWGPGPADEVLYLSSADWMSRNMLRRVEVAWPVEDAALRQRVIDEALIPYLHDGRDAWRLGADGQYERVDAEGASAQAALMWLHGT